MTESYSQQRTNRLKGEGSIYQHTDGRWMYSIMHKGKRLTKSLGTRDENEAQKEYLRVRNNFMGRIDSGELEPSTTTNVTLGEILKDYLKYVATNGHKSAEVIRMVVGKISRAKEFGNGEIATRKVATLTTNDFKAYRNRLVEGKISHATVNYHCSLIRAALNLETKQTPSRVGKIPHIEIVKVRNARKGFLEYDDHTSVLDALPESLKCLFVVAYHSGCRLGEVIGMKWSDVDWTNKVVRLPETKNGNQRNLPFWGSVESHLKKQKAHRDEHFPTCENLFFWMTEDTALAHGGVRMAPGTPIVDFRGSWTAAITEAHRVNSSVKADLLFHDLRRSAIRVMVQECGIPESQAMSISGHETRSMLERYNIVSLKNVMDAGAKLDAWHKNRSKRSKSKAEPRAKEVVPIRRKRPSARTNPAGTV